MSLFKGRYLPCHLAENGDHHNSVGKADSQRPRLGHTESVVDDVATAKEEVWERWAHEGREWFSCVDSGEFFFEDQAGPWERYEYPDPMSGEIRAWWNHSKNTERFFFEPP